MSTDNEIPENQFSLFDRFRIVLLVVLLGFAIWYYLIRTPSLPDENLAGESNATTAHEVLEVEGTTMGPIRYTVKIADWSTWGQENTLPEESAKSQSEDELAAQREKLYAEKEKELQNTVQAALDRVDETMSTYRSDSEVSRFNVSDSTDWFEVSPETLKVVQIALEVSQFTDGTFDITVGPLVNRWGFGPEKRKTPPTQQEIDVILQYVGHQHLQVRENPPAIKKDVPNLKIDLSGIAKGFAVDLVAEALEKKGSKHYLIEVGGETRTRGEKTPGTPWSVGISIPTPLWLQDPQIQRIAQLGSQSMATSGDYLNFIDYEGIRFSHIIDPRTGWPLEKRNMETELPNVRLRLGSVSVVDSSCVRADALTKGFYLLGVEEGLKLADENGIAVLFFLRKEEIAPDGSISSITIEEVASKAFHEKVPSRKP